MVHCRTGKDSKTCGKPQGSANSGAYFYEVVFWFFFPADSTVQTKQAWAFS